MVDYFEFLGLRRAIAIDDSELQRRYIELSRQHHPDFHARSDEATRQTSLDLSSTLNQAYRTLRDRFARARYLIDLELPDLDDAEKKKIPPTLLMEVMEMQEKVFEAQSEQDPERKTKVNAELETIESGMKQKMEDLSGDLDRLASEWDSTEPDSPERIDILKRLNLLLNTRNYLRTLISTIDAAIRGGEPVRH
jgi:molecular chaperone HscB